MVKLKIKTIDLKFSYTKFTSGKPQIFFKCIRNSWNPLSGGASGKEM